MKKSKHSEAEIVKILKEAESTGNIQEVCRKYNIANATYYRWRDKYDGMDVNELKRLKSLEEENRQLKTLVADLSLDIKILKDVNSKKW